MKYPALAVTALAALSVAGWVGAVVLFLLVLALWRAGEPSSVDAVADHPEARLLRALGTPRTRRLPSTTTTTTKEQSNVEQAEMGRGPGVRREGGADGRGEGRHGRAVVAQRRGAHLAGNRSRVPRAVVATGWGTDFGQSPLTAHPHPTAADHYRKAEG